MYIIVAGGGTVGVSLTRRLVGQGHEVALIEMEPLAASRIADELGSVVVAHRADEGRWLEEAGVARADVVVAVTGDDEDNLIICQMAQLIAQKSGSNHPRTIAQLKDPQHEEMFRKLGVYANVSTTPVIAAMIEQMPSPQPVAHLLTLRQAGVELMEFVLPTGAPCTGQRLADVDLPPGAMIALITHDGETVYPTPDNMLNAGDVLIALVPLVDESAVRDVLLGPVA